VSALEGTKAETKAYGIDMSTKLGELVSDHIEGFNKFAHIVSLGFVLIS